MTKITSVLLLAFGLSGCGQTTQHFITDRTNAASVSFNVNLEKPFIAGISSLSGGQAAMLILVGPFTNNAVLLVGKEVTPEGEKIAFRQRLKWGPNAFDVLLNRNTTYQLVVAVQGTRSGAKDIGKVQILSGDNQHFEVKLTETEMSIR